MIVAFGILALFVLACVYIKTDIDEQIEQALAAHTASETGVGSTAPSATAVSPGLTAATGAGQPYDRADDGNEAA